MVDLKQANQRRWEGCKVNPSQQGAFDSVAKRLSAPEAKKRYQAIEKQTGVPWQVIAVIHERESSQRWDRSLAQGDPWNKKSTHVPKGRGPFNSFEEAAVDALVNCGPYAARNKDWSAGGTMALLEKYNGLGYANKGIPSPYIWAGTNQYVKGKYVADGVFDPNAVDKQLGCAGLLKSMGMFSKAPEVTPHTGTAGGVVAGGAIAASQAPSNLIPYIVLGTIIFAVVAFFAVRWYNRRKAQNV